ILYADDDGLAFADGQVSDHAVVGSGVCSFFQHVGGVGQIGGILSDVASGGILLRLSLSDTCLCLRQTCLRCLPCSLLAVVFRFCDQCIFVQTLSASPIELGGFKVGLSAVEVCHGRIQRSVGSDSIGPGRFQSSLRGI